MSGAVILAGGTFGRCNGDLARAAAEVVAAANPAYLFVLGDQAEPRTGDWATLQDYEECYDPLFGRFKSITYAAVGDRDQDTTTGATRGFSPGADAYFGPERVGPPHKNYYSFNIGSWHVIVLDVISGGLKRPVTYDNSSEQIAWLRRDLANHQSFKCTIALWHDPMWKSSTSPPTPNDSNPNHSYRDQPIRGVWMALRDYQADVVVNGGRNIYERFAPMRYDGDYFYPTPTEFAADSLGPRQFSAGLVGDGPTTTPAVEVVHPLSEYRSGGNGFLKLTLGDGVYSWEFLNTRWSTIQDSGVGRCH